MRIFPLCLMSLLVLATPTLAEEELTTVNHVDLDRYLGRWYEIARLPAPFQDDCARSEALYTQRDDGRIGVENSCWTKDGERKVARGVAEVVDRDTNAKLRVSFVPTWLRWTGAGWGDYWIIMLGDDYEYSVVSEPERRYLWILAREPELATETLQMIKAAIAERGFDPGRLILRKGGAEPTE